MSSKRFLIVPEDSSAASRPLPGATMARATLLRSARFIDAISEKHYSLQAKIDCSWSTPKDSSQPRMPRKEKDTSQGPVNGTTRVPARASLRLASRHLWIELALDVTLCHLGGSQHFLDLARLAGGVELLQPLFAELGHRLHRGLEIFARVEFFRVFVEHLADLPGHRHPVVGVDIDLAHAVLDAALNLGDRHAPGRFHLAAIGVDDLLQVLRHRGGAVHDQM